MRVYCGPEYGSDHHLVVIKLIVKHRRDKRIKKIEVSNYGTVHKGKYNLENFHNEPTCFLYKLRLANKFQFMSKEKSAKDLYKELKTCYSWSGRRSFGETNQMEKEGLTILVTITKRGRQNHIYEIE